MKTLLHRLALATLAFAAVNPSVAAGFEVSPSTIDGGGGGSSGGTFSVAGTLGQPDAGTLSGGNYSIEGGLWNHTTAGMGDAPSLSIARSGSEILLSWPRPATGFLLEWSPTLTPTSLWNRAAYPYATSATHISRSEPVSAGPRFYRLAR